MGMAAKQPTASTDKTVAEALAEHHARYRSATGLRISQVGSFVRKTLAVLFPQFALEDELSTDLSVKLQDVEKELGSLLNIVLRGKEDVDTRALAGEFIDRLPVIANCCHLDAEALLEGDPAAESIEEIIISYPGFYATAVYRIARSLLKLEVPLLPRVLTEFAHQRTGIDIHPGAKIGKSFFIDHGTGVVIGGTAVIGNNVKIYQGVTLGALRVERAAKTLKRHPTIEDNVVIYASATILGGNTTVGQNSVIGGNVWLTKSVPAWSRVMFKASDTEDAIPMQSRTTTSK